MTMPTRQQFAEATKTLKDRGFEQLGTMMVDNAKSEGFTEFGMHFLRVSDHAKFWLNFKTIGNLPD